MSNPEIGRADVSPSEAATAILLCGEAIRAATDESIEALRGELYRIAVEHLGSAGVRTELVVSLAPHGDRQQPGCQQETEGAGFFLLQLAQGLRLARRQRRLSQQEVARQMGTTQAYISEMENGIGEPRLSTVWRYARATGCQLGVVLFRGLGESQH